MDEEEVLPLGHVRPQGVQDRCCGGEAVALLDAKPSGVHKAGGLSRRQSRCRGQGGHQVRILGHVHRHLWPGPGVDRLLELQVPPIPLEGGDGHPLHLHRASQGPGGKPKPSLGPVWLHSGLGGAVGLVPLGVILGGQGQGGGYLHAENSHGLEGHVDVVLALQKGGGDEGRGTLQKGQGVEKSGEELAGHVAGKPVFPGQ